MHLVDALLPRQRANTEPALTRSDLIAELIVVTIFDQIATALAHGERVELRGFGAFRVKQRNARIARNPMTGETGRVDEKALPFFCLIRSRICSQALNPA